MIIVEFYEYRALLKQRENSLLKQQRAVETAQMRALFRQTPLKTILIFVAKIDVVFSSVLSQRPIFVLSTL